MADKRTKIYTAAKAGAPGFQFEGYKDLGSAGAEFKLRGTGRLAKQRLMDRLNDVGYTIARHQRFSPKTQIFRVRRIGKQKRVQTRMPKAETVRWHSEPGAFGHPNERSNVVHTTHGHGSFKIFAAGDKKKPSRFQLYFDKFPEGQFTKIDEYDTRRAAKAAARKLLNPTGYPLSGPTRGKKKKVRYRPRIKTGVGEGFRLSYQVKEGTARQLEGEHLQEVAVRRKRGGHKPAAPARLAEKRRKKIEEAVRKKKKQAKKKKKTRKKAPPRTKRRTKRGTKKLSTAIRRAK